METVHGEITIGWLAIQDFAVVLFILLIAGLTDIGNVVNVDIAGLIFSIAFSIGKSLAILGIVFILGKYLIPKVLDVVNRVHNREILLLSVIGIIIAFSLFASVVGLSAPLGAFLAGLLIAETTQNHAVFAEIRPLRDIFSILFFVSIGLSFRLTEALGIWPLILGSAIFVLFIKWASVLFLAKLQGFHDKTAFLVSLSLIPVSEFALIFGREAVQAGLLPTYQTTLTVGIVFISVFVGMPLMKYANKLYYHLLPWVIRLLPVLSKHRFPQKVDDGFPIKDHVVICGYGRVGKYIGRAMEMSGVPFLVVDYNHTVVKHLREKGILVVYGDPADREVLDYAQVDLARIVIIAIPDRHTQELIIANAQNLNKHIKIICRTHHEEDQKRLKALGVQTVIQPEFEAALSITGRLYSEYGFAGNDISGKISRLKIEHGLG